MQCGVRCLCSLLAATSQFSILIGQKMQLTGCHNDNEMRNAICVDTKISIEWPYCSFLYCGYSYAICAFNDIVTVLCFNSGNLVMIGLYQSITKKQVMSNN